MTMMVFFHHFFPHN